MSRSYQVKSAIRSYLINEGVLELSGLPTQGLIDVTPGIPSYSSEELPKIHMGFEIETSEEDTLNLDEVLIQTTMDIKLYYPSPDRSRGALRRQMERFSLEMSNKVRSSGVIGSVSHLVTLSQIENKFEYDRKSNPPVGMCTHRYLISYKWG